MIVGGQTRASFKKSVNMSKDIYGSCKCVVISLHKPVSLLLCAQRLVKIALTNGANKSEFPHFQIKIVSKKVSVSPLNSKNDNLSFTNSLV